LKANSEAHTLVLSLISGNSFANGRLTEVNAGKKLTARP